MNKWFTSAMVISSKEERQLMAEGLTLGDRFGAADSNMVVICIYQAEAGEGWAPQK